MFAKVFSQIFTSSIAENYLVRLVFEDLLVLADVNGVVDMTPEAIARVTNVPLDIVLAGITDLEKPDNRSRTVTEDGCRIVRLDAHRDWGWQVVNYEKYREIRSENDRRGYMREYMRKRRSVTPVNSCKQPLAELAKAEAEADTEVNTTPLPPSKRKRKIGCSIPEDFAVTPEIRKWADEHHVNPDTQIERFRLHYQANGKTMKDWNAAFRNWLISPFQSGGNGNGNGKSSRKEQIFAEFLADDGELESGRGQAKAAHR